MIYEIQMKGYSMDSSKGYDPNQEPQGKLFRIRRGLPFIDLEKMPSLDEYVRLRRVQGQDSRDDRLNTCLS